MVFTDVAAGIQVGWLEVGLQQLKEGKRASRSLNDSVCDDASASRAAPEPQLEVKMSARDVKLAFMLCDFFVKNSC